MVARPKPTSRAAKQAREQAADVEDLGDERSIADDLLAKIASQFSQFDGEDVRATVFQAEGKYGWANLFDLDPDDVASVYERVRTEFGTGKYCVIVYRNGKIAGRHVFAVKVSSAWRAPGTKPNDGDAMAQLVAALREEQKATRELLLQTLTRQATPPASADPFGSIERIVGVMTGISALTGQKQQTDAMTIFSKGVEFATGLAEKMGKGEGGGEGGVMGLVREFIGSGALKTIMEQAAQPQAQPIPMQQPQPVPLRAPAPVPQAPNPQDPQAAIRSQLEFLVRAAREDFDPGPYAAIMLDQMPEELQRQIVAAPNEMVLGQFEPLYPPMAEFREWFGELLDTMRTMCQEEAGLSAETGTDRAATGEAASPIQAKPPAG